MYFYFVMGPVLVGALVMIVWLRNMRKHDTVLYRFCQLRRDVMTILRNDSNIAQQDYFDLRVLVNALNDTIHNYNEMKTSSFNIFRCLDYGRKARRIDSQIQQHQVENPMVEGLYHAFAYALILAVLTFLPWPQIGLKVVPFIFTVVANIGIESAKARAKRMLDFTSWLRVRAQQEQAFHHR